MNIKYKIINAWDCVRYDIPRFIKNLWRFRKALWQFRWYDPHGLYVFNNIGLTEMAEKVEKRGYEIDISRLKKVEKMRRAAQLYKNFIDDNFIEQAESELGELIMNPIEWKPSETHTDCYELIDNDTAEERVHNKAIFERARELEEEQWNELHIILKGQDISKYKPKKQDWNDWFDGSGMRGWWD